MKKLKIENPKKLKAKRYLLFSAIILVFCGIMIYNAFSNSKNLKEENFNSAEGMVVSFEINENEYSLGIQNVNDEQEVTTVVLNVEVVSNLPTLKDNLKIDDKVKLIYDLDSKDLYKVTINDNLLYDRIADAVDSYNKLIIFYIVVAVAIVGFMIWNLIIYIKQPANKEVDYIEHIITSSHAVTNTMLKSDSKTMKMLQKEKLVNKMAFIVILIAILASFMLKAVIQNTYVMLAICLVVIGGIVALMVAFRPKLYSKNLNIFVDDYLDYLNTGKNKTERTIFFKKEGLKVINEDQTYFFDYHELNLYTVCVYSKTNAPVNIFICSQLPEKEEYKDIQDFIIPLSRDLYQDIMENSIFINGFENLIENLYQESKSSVQEVKEGLLLKYYR